MKPQAEKRVLLLTSAREAGWINSAPTEVAKGLHAFIAELNSGDQDTSFAVSTLDKLEFTVTGGTVQIFDTYTGKDLSDYDLVHFRNVSLFPDYARAIMLYMAYHQKKTFEPVDTASIPDYGKLSQMVLFALNGVSVPNTWAVWAARDIGGMIKSKNISFPFILKANDGIKGNDNYLIRDMAQLDRIVEQSPQIQFVIQSFIPNDGDYRVLYLGEGSPLVFKRTASGDTHLNNTSKGGASEEITLDRFDHNALSMAHRASELTRRKLAGVDAIQHNKTGEWFILEVNANPALSSGTLLERKVVAYKKMIMEIL